MKHSTLVNTGRENVREEEEGKFWKRRSGERKEKMSGW